MAKGSETTTSTASGTVPTGDQRAEIAELASFLKSDRQWSRRLRLAHAAYQMSAAPFKREQDFWRAVIRRNATTPEELSASTRNVG